MLMTLDKNHLLLFNSVVPWLLSWKDPLFGFLNATLTLGVKGRV